jgi:hypothetical protein
MLCTILIAQFIAVFANVNGGTFLAMAGKDAVVLLADSLYSTKTTGTWVVGKTPRTRYGWGAGLSWFFLACKATPGLSSASFEASL